MSENTNSLKMSVEDIDDEDPIYMHVYMQPTKEDIKWMNANLNLRID